LNKAGYSVQLNHNSTETTWEDHGYVIVKVGGKEVVSSKQVQHNKNYGNRNKELDEMLQQFLETAKTAEAPKSA
jgi:hypothetical protein